MENISGLHYIVDGSGNYYRMNGNNQLVVADGIECAEVFCYTEAKQRIGEGKKAHFYSTVPVEGVAPVEEQEGEPIYMGRGNETSSYDIKNIDWSEYLTHFCYIASGIHNYQDELNQALSDIDVQICDLLHYIELYNLDEEESLRVIELLKECREQRRDVKDEMFRTECFKNSIGTSSNIAKVKDCIKQIKKLDTRVYRPRKLQELFKNSPEKTVRDSKLGRVFESDSCMDIVNRYSEKENIYYEEEESNVMEYTRQKTIFDGKDNDWGQFARQQAAFFANAEQYIYNLQTDVSEIDTEIEEILREVEDANYNVTQGYKVFKHLKELRNLKKEKQKELECLYILTERFDCAAMAELMESCVSEIEYVMEPEHEWDAKVS